MSYNAPKYQGYGRQQGGYGQFHNGFNGKTYNETRHSTSNVAASLLRSNPKQNKPVNGDESYEGSGTGSQIGVVMNEIRIDQHERVKPVPVDPNGPKTDRPVSTYNNYEKPKLVIKKSY